MSSPRSWFLQGPMRQIIEIGKVINLSHPTPSKWRILEVLHEHEYQAYEGANDPSYASIQLSCEEVNGSRRRSMMRIVIQIPYFNTELEDSAVRARQATTKTFRTEEFLAFLTFTKKGSTVTPPLLGYREDRQDLSGLVPGGFITYYAWYAVPGIRLGDYTGKAPQFWKLDRWQREEIRVAFRDTFLKITSMGIWPDSAAADNLVWNSETKTLTWVGFRDCDSCKPQPWRDSWLPLFDLVQAPNTLWADPDWDGDTSEWKY